MVPRFWLTVFVLWGMLLTGCATSVSPSISTAEADQIRDEENNTMPTNTTYGKKTGWGTSGQLQAGVPSKTVSLQANFESIDAAGSYTIEFSISKGAAVLAIAEALITWSVEGNFVTRRITVSDGVSVTGVGQAVKIIISDVTAVGPETPLGTPYGVSVQVSPGTRGGSKQGPTLLVRSPTNPNVAVTGFDLLGPVSATVNVPADAGIIALYVTAFDLTTKTLAAGEITVAQGVGNPFFPTQLFDAFLYRDWVPITAGTSVIKITNNGNNVVGVGLTFMIDG